MGSPKDFAPPARGHRGPLRLGGACGVKSGQGVLGGRVRHFAQRPPGGRILHREAPAAGRRSPSAADEQTLLDTLNDIGSRQRGGHLSAPIMASAMGALEAGFWPVKRFRSRTVYAWYAGPPECFAPFSRNVLASSQGAPSAVPKLSSSSSVKAVISRPANRHLPSSSTADSRPAGPWQTAPMTFPAASASVSRRPRSRSW